MKDTLVSANWLRAHQTNSEVVVLDASPLTNISGLRSNYKELVIPGARYFDLKGKFSDPAGPFPNTLPSAADFEREARLLGINNNSWIVIYDNLGIYTSPRVWWMFRTMGHQHVHVLNGGLPCWVEEEYPTTDAHDTDFSSGNFRAKYQPQAVKSLNQLLENIDTKSSQVIDARSSGRFRGTAPEPREGLSSGHIPGSCNLPFEEVLENGKYKSDQALLEVFKRLPLGNQPLTFSCGSGLTACIILLAAELVLTNPKSVFDGSWTEWASTEGAPIVK